LIQPARLGLKLYVAVFVLAGAYASLLLLAAMRGLHNAQNSIIFGCGILFIVRAFFASRAGIVRVRELADPEPAALARTGWMSPWRHSELELRSRIRSTSLRLFGDFATKGRHMMGLE
jgi:hypothetical protein